MNVLEASALMNKTIKIKALQNHVILNQNQNQSQSLNLCPEILVIEMDLKTKCSLKFKNNFSIM